MITSFLYDFLPAYIEFIMAFVLSCSIIGESINKHKIAFLIGIINASMGTVMYLLPIEISIYYIIYYSINILSLAYIFKMPIINVIKVYVLISLLSISIELLQLPFWALFFTNLFDGFVAYAGTTLSLLITLILYRFVPLNKFYDLIKNRSITFWMIISNTFLICFGIILFARINKNDIFSHYILILVVLLLLLFINGEVYLNYRKKLEQQKILATYEENLSIVDSLIEKISVRQHDYDNDLQAIQSLGYLHTDYESLKNALLETTGHYILNRTQETLLKLNLHLFAGFLVSKVRQAESQSKKLDITIDNFNLVTTITEYELIEHVGILIDNAMEATPQGESIYAVVSSSQGTISFKIKNPGPKISSELLKSIFKKGHTTKKKDSRPHGIGLYKLNKYVKEHNGRLIVKNEFINDTTYLCFELII